MPWSLNLPNRFTLRTLLIAMTLVAVVLGLAVWAATNLGAVLSLGATRNKRAKPQYVTPVSN